MKKGASVDHPDEILTASYLEGRLPGEARDRFESHLASCDECRSSLALLRASASSGSTAVPEEFLLKARKLSDHPRRLFPIPRFMGIAASLVLVAAAAFWFLRTRIEGLSPRGAGSGMRGELSTAFSDLSPAAGAAVPVTLVQFRWSGVEGADRYELTVFDAAGAKLADLSSEGAERTALWPPDHPALSPGSYFWKIRAMALDRALVESETIPFEVVP